MRSLAEALLTGTAEEGQTFTWDQAEVSRLDNLCEEFLRTNPPDERRHSMIMAMGAYIGELLVRHHGGRWKYDPDQRAAVIAMPNGLDGYPHNKVAKRLDRGSEHNLFQFYWYVATRDVPPGSDIHPMP